MHTVSSEIPNDLYVASQVRELDRRAIEDHGVPGIVLMKRAGTAVFDYLADRWPDVTNLSIWCGAGNNGGDGYIVAGLAKQRGFNIQLVQVGREDRLQGDALLACQWAKDQGVVFEPFSGSTQPQGGLVLDALLGTGLQGEVRGDFAAAIERINNANIPVLAVDIASGLCSDRGVELGQAVFAEATVSFIGLKRGLFTGEGPNCSGEILFSDLAVPNEIYADATASAQRTCYQQLQRAFQPRPRTAHKGNFGHVLVVGGNFGMGGAAIMASQAACRVGAGLVSVATQPEHLPGVLARCPEVMTHPVSSGQDLESLVEPATVIVIGPGLGKTAWSEQLLRVVLATQKPLVVDADALNLIASGIANHQQRDNWIITPHPGEAARLLGKNTSEVQTDRFQTVVELQKKYGGVALLKGAGTLVYGGEEPINICCNGNPGMAAGGMGDVLSGLLGGLVAQGFSVSNAATIGACLHGAAADRAAIGGERGMVASDVINEIRALVNTNAVELSQETISD